MKGPGGNFEAEIHRSFPKKTTAGRPVNIWKIPDPATWFGKGKDGEGRDGQRFSPKNPYDFRVFARARSSQSWGRWPFPVIDFALECKRTAATISKKTGLLHSRLAFSAVEDHQVKELEAASDAGAVAGILWLSEMTGPPDMHKVWFIPIATFLDYRESSREKSIPLLLMPVGVALGKIPPTQIYEDVARGTSNRYWEMSKFMAKFGADVT